MQKLFRNSKAIKESSSHILSLFNSLVVNYFPLGSNKVNGSLKSFQKLLTQIFN